MLSILLGEVTAFLVPALLILLMQLPIFGTIIGQVFWLYLSGAGMLEPFVFTIFPMKDWFPEGGASGAFALSLLSIALYWGVIFSIVWHVLLRRW